MACSAGADPDAPATASSSVVSSPDLVISQVYGGGGNPGASQTHDFIELFNRGSQPVSLQGRSLQYASATGTFSSTSSVVTLPNVTLQPGRYFLVQLASGGTNGAALPTADLVTTGTQALNVSGTAGKVALVASSALLNNCGSTTTQCAAGAWIDFVGYGAVSQAEGSAAAAPSNTSAVVRALGGCADIGSNATDFSVAAPVARNSSAPANFCTDAGSGDDSGATADADASPATQDGGGDDASADGGAIADSSADSSTRDASTNDSGAPHDAGHRDSGGDGGKKDASKEGDADPQGDGSSRADASRPGRDSGGGPGPTAPPSETDEPSHTSSPSCAVSAAGAENGQPACAAAWLLAALALVRARRRRRSVNRDK